jgi:hypothetical protein
MAHLDIAEHRGNLPVGRNDDRTHWPEGSAPDGDPLATARGARQPRPSAAGPPGGPGGRRTSDFSCRSGRPLQAAPCGPSRNRTSSK